jgi:GTPase SAR1 family protein
MYNPYKFYRTNNLDDNTFIPSEEQKIGAEKITAFLNSTQKIFVLKGAAGTGKTSLMYYVLKDFYKRGKRIAVSAFTNRATNEISRRTSFADGITLYKLLKLQADTETDKLFFTKKGKPLVDNYDIVVVDEASMILDRDLNFLIQEINKTYSTTKLIITGDVYQLEAVGQESESIAFNFDNCYELKSIIRQAENSNIIKYATEVRKIQDRIKNGEKISIKTKLKPALNSDNDDLLILNDSKEFLRLMIEDFKSDEYKNSSSYVKCIAYRNASIDKVNSLIRRNIFGENVDLICVGENITLKSPVIDFDTGYNLYDSSDELEITDIIETAIYNNREDHHGVLIKFPYYKCLVTRRFDGLNGEMNIINPNFKEKFDADVSEWGKAIKKEEKNKDIYRLEYYPFKSKFHSVSYNYAGTAHSNQGGTYNRIFLIEDDIEQVSKATDLNLWKSKYVGYTRASKKLIILNRHK